MERCMTRPEMKRLIKHRLDIGLYEYLLLSNDFFERTRCPQKTFVCIFVINR